jgi:hypothetical protein
MQRNVIGKNGRQIVSGLSNSELSKPWSTSPWLSAHRIGAHHGYRIDGAEQAQGFPAPQARKHSAKRTTGQLAALNAWEDDGGRTSGRGETYQRQEP